MSQDIYNNPIRLSIETMASKRKQMTSKVRGILESYIAPKGWKRIPNTTEDDGLTNDHILSLNDIENLTEEIVNIKLHGKR